MAIEWSGGTTWITFDDGSTERTPERDPAEIVYFDPVTWTPIEPSAWESMVVIPIRRLLWKRDRSLIGLRHEVWRQ